MENLFLVTMDLLANLAIQFTPLMGDNVDVVVAGVYGAITAKISILYLQAFPAAITIALILLL